MHQQLTDPQAKVLACIKRFIALNKYPPTRAEIAQDMGYSSANAADEHVKALVRKGAIRVKAGIARSITVEGAA